MLSNITSEQRQEYLVLAKESKEKKKLAGAHLRKEFLDEPRWREMASEIGFRLAPSYALPSDVKYIRRLLNKIGKDLTWFSEQTGFTKLSDFAKVNPTWPCYTYQGLLLEAYFSEKVN
ncbi:hypothetical protein D9M71_525820 [compost metagenome]